MFEAAFGKSQEQFYADGGLATHTNTIPVAKPSWDASGDDSTEEVEEHVDAWAGWRDGVAQRDAAKAAKQWPDGTPIGRGHDAPYLKEKWARAMAAGMKKVEGRPNEGVRRRTLHHSMLSNLLTSLSRCAVDSRRRAGRLHHL